MLNWRPGPWDEDAPHATVDLDAVRANVSLLRSFAAPGVRLLAPVKGDAYGHGLLPVARALALAGVEAFGVATAAEALELREGGVGEVLLFAPVRAGVAELVAADVVLTVAQAADLQVLERNSLPKRARIHLKVETGMGRLGVDPAGARDVAAAVDRSRVTELEGVWTQLATADEPDAAMSGSSTDRQLTAFATTLENLERDGLRPRWAHAANSAAVVVRRDAHLDMVRPGIALYGQPPSPSVAALVPSLRPALRLDAPITFVKRVPAGAAVSYGGTWTAARDTVIATVRMGYADGYPRSLSSLGVASYRGRRVPVVGRVCMDQLMLDLGPDGDAELGERVDLIGGAGPSAVEVAEAAGSFVYELLAGIGPRVVRRYRSGPA